MNTDLQRSRKGIQVAVLRGGPSDEYDVSMQTGSGVLEALRHTDYNPIDTIITRSGEWLLDGIVRDPAHILERVDVAFLALHGAYGEDGTVQRLLDRYNIPYTGSKAYASSVAMNKMLTKELLRNHGVNMAPHLRVTRDSKRDLARIVHTISGLFGPEYVIKPMHGGSSIGTKMADSSKSLLEAIETVLSVYPDVLVEQRIRGREATCGVVENFRNERIYRLPAIEIVPPKTAGYFAANVKYSGETEEICPGRFSKQEKEQLENIAHTAHEILGLSQYSRSDFMVSDNGIYFLEVNTLPGLTSESLLPKALAAIGCSYIDFIDHLIRDTITRT